MKKNLVVSYYHHHYLKSGIARPLRLHCLMKIMSWYVHHYLALHYLYLQLYFQADVSGIKDILIQIQQKMNDLETKVDDLATDVTLIKRAIIRKKTKKV